MPLTVAQMSGGMSLSLQKLVAGFPAISQGPDVLNFDLTGIDLSVYTQAYLAVLTATTTVDLTSFTNLVTESVTLSKALAMVVACTGGTCVVTPGGSNGLAAWFFGSSGVAFADGDSMVFLRNPKKTPVTVDATHKTVTFTISGATVAVAILGG